MVRIPHEPDIPHEFMRYPDLARILLVATQSSDEDRRMERSISPPLLKVPYWNQTVERRLEQSLGMTSSDNAESEACEVPSWRREARQSADVYRQGIALLGASLEFAVERLQAIYMAGSDEGGGQALLPVLAARAIATVDAIHALLTVGRVEQADMLLRTLVDLQADAHLLVATQDAVYYYADWATVEQARDALRMRPDEVSRPGRDLAARRVELANELIARLGEYEPEQARALDGRPLEEVLAEFCKFRYRSRRPSSWRQGYMDHVGLSTGDARARIVQTAAEVAQLEGVPEEIQEFFEETFTRELELLFGYLSGEVHNSPLSINRLIDPSSRAIRVYGDAAGIPRPLLGAFQHLLRIMLLLEHSWIEDPAISEWSSLALAMSESVGDVP